MTTQLGTNLGQALARRAALRDLESLREDERAGHDHLQYLSTFKDREDEYADVYKDVSGITYRRERLERELGL